MSIAIFYQKSKQITSTKVKGVIFPLTTVFPVAVNASALFSELVGGDTHEFLKHLAMVTLILEATQLANFCYRGIACQEECFALFYANLVEI